MATGELERLMHADIDGELDARQRGELARHLLANLEARTQYESLRRLCASLDAMPAAEPPAGFTDSVLRALPEAKVSAPRHPAAMLHWRFAAMVGGVLLAGVVVFAILDGSGTAPTDASGTMAAARSPTVIETVRLERAPVLGSVSLYRSGAQLGLAFDLAPGPPVDVIVTSQGYEVRIDGVAHAASGTPNQVTLAGLRMAGQPVALTFVIDGRPVASASFRAPNGP